MCLARSICADKDIEAFSEFQAGCLEDVEIPDPERLEHWPVLHGSTMASHCMPDA